eukprot:GEMP01007485.1.p1 GENE.GEMP01007485.1~~GEMP01007485.1.p1  ORF type:complete len:673 (+),score=128.10 GEMP01007485.1:76-2094(+)
MDSVSEEFNLILVPGATPENTKEATQEYEETLRKNRRILYLRRLFYLLDVSRGVKRDEPKLPGWWPQIPNTENALDFAMQRANTDFKDYCDFQAAATRLQQKAQNRREKEIPCVRRKKTSPCTDVSIFSNYFVGELLSKGSVGKVHLGLRVGQSNDSDSFVAIKTVEKFVLKDKENIERIREEISIAKTMNHHNVIRLFCVTEFPNHILFCMEYAHGGDLLSYVMQKGRLVLPESRHIFSQIHQALDYLHESNVCHRDVKPENVLLTEEAGSGRRTVKLADFGVAAYTQNTDGSDRLFDQYCGTISYMAPEVLLRRRYLGKPIDCWSLGVLLYTIVYGTQPFKGPTTEKFIEQITSASFSLANCVYDSATDVIRALLDLESSRRPTMKMLGGFEWMSDKTNPTWLRARNGTGGGARARLQYNIGRSQTVQMCYGEPPIDHHLLEKHDSIELLFPTEEPERWFGPNIASPPPRQQDNPTFRNPGSALWPRSSFTWTPKPPHIGIPAPPPTNASNITRAQHATTPTPMEKMRAMHKPYPFVRPALANSRNALRNVAAMETPTVAGAPAKAPASSSGYSTVYPANSSAAVSGANGTGTNVVQQRTVQVSVMAHGENGQHQTGSEGSIGNAFLLPQATIPLRPQFQRLNMPPRNPDINNCFCVPVAFPMRTGPSLR